MTHKKVIALVCGLLLEGTLILGGAGSVFAQQNLVVSGTLTVAKDIFLNTASGNTSVNGNITLGSSSSNLITYNGVAATSLDMGLNDLLNASRLNGQILNLGSASSFTGQAVFFNGSGSGSATVQAAPQGSSGGNNYTYTIPNAGASASFVVTQGAQMISGGKTFSSATSATTPLVATNSGSGGTALSVTSGTVNIAGLSGSLPVFTDASKNLTNTGSIPAGDLPLATTTTVGAVKVDNSTITVNGSGQITAIGAAPSGSASGDLANSYPNPTIATNQQASTDIAASLNAHTPTAPVNAAAGGTGNATYTSGDILVATGATTLTPLHQGTTGQVLGMNGSSPQWITNGATVTNSTTGVAVTNATPTLGPTSPAGYIRVTNSTSGTVTVTGINTQYFMNGSVVTIINASSSSSDVVQLVSHSGTAGEQFDLPGGTPLMLGQSGTATFIYDGTAGYWELTGTN